MINNKRVVRPVSVLVVLIIILGVAGGCAPDPPIVIGLIAGLSGTNSHVGVISRDAVTLAIDSTNENGGIDGRLLELKVYDHKFDMDTARVAVGELQRDGAVAIIGPFLSSMSPLVSEYKPEDILFLSPTVSTSALSGLDDCFIRVIPASVAQSKVLASRVSQSGLSRVAVVYSSVNAAYSQELAADFSRRANEAGVAVPVQLQFESMDVTNLASTIVSVDPDALLMVVSGYDGASLAQEIWKTGYRLPLFAPQWTNTSDFLELGGQAVEGATLTELFQGTRNTPRFRDFERQYTSRYQIEPDLLSIYAYETTGILIEALRDLPEKKPKSIRDRIIEIGEFEGLFEPIRIDAFGDAERTTSLVVVTNGAYVIQ